MHIVSGTLPGVLSLHQPPRLSRAARTRLPWFDWHATHGQNVSFTCRHFGISRQTFYRWRRRFRSQALATLEDRSHRPRRVRQPTWSGPLAEAVLQLRRENPRWGKDKLTPLLHAGGWTVSCSMVGRILSHLKASGQLREPPLLGVTVLRKPLRRPYAVRKPRGYRPIAPGDLVQVDTMDLRPLPGVILKQFTARDMVSRWDVLAVGTRATAAAATRFLDELQSRSPYAIKAIQVDGGSEFMAGFEEACQKRAIPLFVLPPRSPKLNGCVERANRTHAEEFWDCYDGDLELPAARAALLAWERRYNTYRPHQALGYLTPQQVIERFTNTERSNCH